MDENPWSAFMTFLSSDIAPAWVQAVGSVAAVVAALVLLYVQHDLERAQNAEDQRAAMNRRRGAIEAFMLAIQGNVDRIHRVMLAMPAKDWISMAAHMANAKREIAALRELLSRFDISDFDDSELWRHWATLTSELIRSEAEFTEFEALADRSAQQNVIYRNDVMEHIPNSLNVVRQGCDFVLRSLRR